jgi:sec-independent protein translocase protein TatA
MNPLLLSLAFIEGIGGPEMVMILVVVLVLFGGQKLPEFARGLGKSIREFKKAAAGVEEEFKRALDQDEQKKINAATPAALPAPTPENSGHYQDPYHTEDPYHADPHHHDYHSEAGPSSIPAVTPVTPPGDPTAPAPAATPSSDAPTFDAPKPAADSTSPAATAADPGTPPVPSAPAPAPPSAPEAKS